MHVGEAIDRYRAGELDVHEVDGEIHHYDKAVRELWKCCWSRGVGSNMILIERALRMMEEEGTSPDW